METLYVKINSKFEIRVVIVPRINIHDVSKNLKYLNIYRSQYDERVRSERRMMITQKSWFDPLIFPG